MWILPRTRHGLALSLALMHLALAAFMQIQDYAWFYAPQDVGSGAEPSFYLRWPLMQAENLLFASLLGLGFLVAGRWLVSRWLYFLAYLGVNLFLIADQVVMALGGGHLRLSYTESVQIRWDLVLDSIRAGITGWSYLNLVLVGIMMTIFFLSLRRLDGEEESGGPPRVSVAGRVAVLVLLTAWMLVGWQVASITRTFQLDRHPVFVFVMDAWQRHRPKHLEVRHVPEMYPLRYGAVRETASEARALSGALERLRSRGRRPHVVFICLESFGTLQGLRDGAFDPKLVPEMSRLGRFGVTFDTIYTAFPATSRAHIPLMTGGPTLTEGSVFDELVQPYGGPTLISLFKDAGYKTGLFACADLDFENLDLLYQRCGFDRFCHAGLMPKAFQDETRLNSWGSSEEAILPFCWDWIDEVQAAGEEPLYLQYITNATHHPYSWPASFTPPFEGDAALVKYHNSIAYVDWIVGRFVAEFKARGLYEDTLFVLLGDHGEAFGDPHPENFLHKEYLYEENVRTFLTIAAPGLLERPVHSHRIGAMGDVLPTLAAALGQPDPGVLGQSLFGDEWQPRIAYFHKIAQPEMWGLRDGQWKFMENLVEPKKPQLYNLDEDPREQHNLAGRCATQSELYGRLCGTWYERINREYISNIARPPAFDGPIAASASGSGSAAGSGRAEPLAIDVGYLDAGGSFHALKKLHPRQKFLAVSRWKPGAEKKKFVCDWVTPARDHKKYRVFLEPGLDRYLFYYSGDRPLPEGKWEVGIWDDKEFLLGRTFTVDASAPLHLQE